MEFLAPPLVATMHIRLQINNGSSLRMALRDYLMTHNDPFTKDLQSWLGSEEETNPKVARACSHLQQQLFNVLRRGLAGEPISDQLKLLEDEMLAVSREDINAHIERLPALMLIPMILFQFPSFMLILIGPIFSQLFQTLGGIQ